MPSAPPTACSTRGCPNYAEYRGKCKACSGTRERVRGTRQERGYDDAEQRLAKRVLQEEPLCRVCESQGVYTFSAEADHTIPIDERPDLRLVRENLQGLCKSCHSRKTITEMNGRRKLLL